MELKIGWKFILFDKIIGKYIKWHTDIFHIYRNSVCSSPTVGFEIMETNQNKLFGDKLFGNSFVAHRHISYYDIEWKLESKQFYALIPINYLGSCWSVKCYKSHIVRAFEKAS